jgi:hypothetical protein
MVVENRSEGLTEPQTTPRNLLHSQDRSASTPEGLAGEPVRAVSLAVLFWRESLIEGRILAPGKILTGKPSRAQSPEALARARARTWHSS